MLDNLNGPNETLEVFEAALYGAEPEESEPTEEVEAVEISEDAEESEEETEVEESEEESEEEATEEESETDEEGEEQATYEITIDGEPQEVTLDELLSGYQRQADYTRKTQATAEQRKQLETQQATLNELSQSITDTAERLEKLVQESERDIDWDELRETDPSAYLKQKELLEERKTALKDAEAQKATLLQQKAVQENQKLHQKLTTWADPKQREADIAKIQGYLSEIGFEQNEYQEVDHRLILALLDGARYREMQSKSAKVVKKVKKAPKVTKPGKKATSADINARDKQQKMDRLRKSGREEDALEVFKFLV